MAKYSLFIVVVLGVLSVDSWSSAQAQEPRWTVSRFFEPPFTSDGGVSVEGTTTAPRWAWHGSLGLRWAYDTGLADEAHQTAADLRFGLGLLANLEIALGLPAMWTVGTKGSADPETGRRSLYGMGEDGVGIGDLKVGLLWSAFSAENGGFGLLFGLVGAAPTGDHERLMGEGGFSAEPFASLAFQLLSTRVSFNLGYRYRPEHIAPDAHGGFEQDDDIFWRFAVRVPRKNDVAWSVEAEGTVGILTEDGPWPKNESRPFWLGGSVDFPLDRLHRMALFAGVGPTGEAVPDFCLGMRVMWLPVLPDEDGDGVGGGADDCPLLAEDRDGYEDEDGCPDLDNDKDGFPDDEDACPLDKAEDFSDDGC